MPTQQPDEHEVFAAEPSIIPSNEAARIAALRRYEILDTPPDGTFDSITKVVANLLNVPIAIVSLVDTDRIWFKSHHGIEATEIGRDPGLCASVILHDAPRILKDARLDPHTMTNPLVTGAMGLRFYVGIPLVTHDNFRLGSLCAVDLEPRDITPLELDTLKNLARVVMDQMELRLGARRVHGLNKDLISAKERIQIAVETARIGIWELDPVTNKFLWDDQMHALYGLQPGDFGGSSAQWLSMLHPEDAARSSKEWLQCMKLGITYRGDFRISHPSGKWRYIRSLGRMVTVAGSDAVRAVGSNWDITEEYEAAEALHKSKVAAERAERAKAEFLAVMSHEIRTPMNGVLGFAELLGATQLLPHQRELLQTVISSGQALLRIIDDTLDFSRIEAGQMPLEHNAFAPAVVIRDVCTLLNPRARQKGVTLHWKSDCATLPPQLLGDAGRLRQVLLNLVSNAIKFTEHGEVVIEMLHRGVTAPGDPELSEDVPVGAHLLEFRITDSGLGMSPAQLECIFQPFAQADASIARRFGGSGLGLSISHRLVKLMGGSMSATSTPGKGSRFTFMLPMEAAPIVLAPDPALAVSRTTKEFAVQHPLRILVVDDDAINRKLAKLFLTNLGYHALLAANGSEALDIFHTEHPDTLLVDEQMPGMSGPELARAIRKIEEAQNTPHRSFISALTANAMGDAREAAIAAGMDDFLTKPLRTHGLCDTLAKASAHKMKQANQSAPASQMYII